MEALSLFDIPPPATIMARPRSRPRPRPVVTGPLLLAVDGDSLTHRAFHAYGPTGGTRGFLALLAAVVDRTGPDGLLVGFDCRSRSHRRRRYPDYKATRPPKHAALAALLATLPGLLCELGVPVAVAEGWEADDVLASAAAAAAAAGWRSILATSDRDAFALIDARTTVLRLRSGVDRAIEVTAERLRADVGVAPCQYIAFAALRGDTSDNLPGVPGIGPARAVALLAAYDTVEAAVADPIGCRSVLGRRAGEALLDDLVDEATSVYRRNVTLMTVCRDLPIDLRATGRTATPAHIGRVLGERGLAGLGGRLAVALAVRPDAPPPPTDADLPVAHRSA